MRKEYKSTLSQSRGFPPGTPVSSHRESQQSGVVVRAGRAHGQQTYYQQANIRMRLHGLRQLFDENSVASCQQTCYKLIVKTSYPQACCNL